MMSRKIVSLLLAALLVLCFGSACAEGTSVTDMMGREIVIDGPVTRVVALTPADCEILCALGGEALLVGRGAYCDYPESIAALPVVQSGADTNIEEILALEPQVVLMGDMGQTKEQVSMLERNGVQVVISDANDIEGVYADIRMIGALTARDAQAEALIADMQATFDGIAAKCPASGRTVYFEVSPLQYGLWAAGRNTFMDELAAMCGLTNAFADVDGWGAVSEEQVLSRDPDYIVTTAMYYGVGMAPAEEIAARTGWDGLKAVRNGRILQADSNALTRPGPRLKDAAVELFDFVSAAGTQAE